MEMTFRRKKWYLENTDIKLYKRFRGSVERTTMKQILIIRLISWNTIVKLHIRIRKLTVAYRLKIQVHLTYNMT